MKAIVDNFFVQPGLTSQQGLGSPSKCAKKITPALRLQKPKLVVLGCANRSCQISYHYAQALNEFLTIPAPTSINPDSEIPKQ